MPRAKTEPNMLLARMTNSPLLLEPGSEDVFAQSILEMQMHPQYREAMSVNDAQMLQDDFWDDDDSFMSWLRPYSVQDGVLTIPVQGVLMNKLSIKFGSYATGYQYIEQAVIRGMQDSDVNAIILNIDSPGGEVAGNFELSEFIAEQRVEKPIRAVANDHAYSAAYSIASAAESITLARSGGVGSIGVVTMHMDASERMDKMGVKITFIYAGKHKVDGNPYQPLPDSVKGRIQDKIDRIYGEFVALVATNRDMSEEAVQKTEALTYDASNALEVGLADRIGTLQTEMADLTLAETEMEHMATNTPKTPAASEGGTFTQDQLDAAVASAKTEGNTEGVAAERSRISGIFGLEEAKDRPAAAKMAVNAGMSVDDAKAALETMPKETAGTPAPTEDPKSEAPAPTPFAENMDGPGVGAEVDAPKAEGVTSDTLLDSYTALTGNDPRQRAN